MRRKLIVEINIKGKLEVWMCYFEGKEDEYFYIKNPRLSEDDVESIANFFLFDLAIASSVEVRLFQGIDMQGKPVYEIFGAHI